MYDISVPINYDIILKPEDIAERKNWPPPRFVTRDDRMRVLDELHFGNYTSFTKDKHISPVNYFRAYNSRVSNMLMQTPPAIEVNNASIEAFFELITDMVAQGGALARWDGETLHAHEPRTWYPMVDGGHAFARAYTSPDAPSPGDDRINFIIVGPDGETVTQDYAYTTGSIGTLQSEAGLPTNSLVAVIPLRPRQGMWGTSKYEALLGPALEISKRFGHNSRLLDVYARPIPVFKGNRTDLENRYLDGPGDQDVTDADLDIDSAAADRELQRQLKLVEALIGVLEQDAIALNAEVVDLEFLQPSVAGVAASLAQIEEARTAVSDITGMPAFSGDYQPPSGESLKRQLLHFYAETRSIQTAIINALEPILDIPIVWEHVFDTFETSDSDARESSLNEAMSAFNGTV